MFLRICFTIIFLLKCSKSFKTSTCLLKNEEFSLCGWKCPVTCINYRLLKEPLTSLCPEKWECYIGCRCSAGYVRDEYSKNCVMIQDCPTAGAPTILNSIPREFTDGQLLNPLRNKRSKIIHGYGMGVPVDLSSHYSSYLPYQWNMRPYINPYAGYSNFGYQSLYGCGRGFSRSEDQDDHETDIEQEHSSPHKHSAEITKLSPSRIASVGQLVSTPGGPTYGVFPDVPNGNGCYTPLLFSCAPTVVPGKFMQGSSQMGYGLPPSFNTFRDVENTHFDPHMQEQIVAENTAAIDHN